MTQLFCSQWCSTETVVDNDLSILISSRPFTTTQFGAPISDLVQITYQYTLLSNCQTKNWHISYKNTKQTSKKHKTCKLLSEHTRQKIKPKDSTHIKTSMIPKLTSSLIQQHKTDIWREHLNKQCYHKLNMHTPDIQQQNIN